MNSSIASREEWLVARKQLLSKEKELTKLQDEVSRQRRELPRVRVEKEYIFDAPDGKRTLAELFGGRSQLIVYHFMLAPGRKEGCVGCSFFADHVDGPNLHFAPREIVGCERDMIVIIEVAAEAGYPREAPTHAPLVSLDLG